MAWSKSKVLQAKDLLDKALEDHATELDNARHYCRKRIDAIARQLEKLEDNIHSFDPWVVEAIEGIREEIEQFRYS